MLGQQIVIENRSGASGNIGMEAAARAAPDGYTIFLGNIGTIAINPAIFEVSRSTRCATSSRSRRATSRASWSQPAVPANTVAELVALAKANPGELNFASTGRAR